MEAEERQRVAYFCMEYGIDQSLPIYAGGLGVLAGDHLKAAHDLDAPMVGLGILWREDYTKQLIGEEGRPYDLYPSYAFEDLEETGVVVRVQVRGEDVVCRVFLAEGYGNSPLYLLDASYQGSEHGWMTSKLYGGGEEDRLAAEIILGVGGVRALRAMEIEVDKYHFNEGHALLAGMELIREKIEMGKSFEEALEATRSQIVFTTHTPVAAGNEIYEHGLLQHMGAYNGLTYEQMCQLGGDPFNMTAACLRLSHLSNGVSELHGKTARRMWRNIPDRAPIIAITNGVHLKTWQDQRIREAYEQGEDLASPHKENKRDLIEFVEDRNQIKLDENVLTIGFARRAAPYKRSELIFRNADVIHPLLQDQRIQIIFSGKAHPKDQYGKDIVQRLVQMDRKYKKSVVFIENYDLEIAAHLVQGCDVWLNNPRRPLEASGTSGMKAALNGVLNLSVLDGWLAEGPEHGVSGWIIDEVFEELGEITNDEERDLEALYHLLFEEVVPTYYQEPERWEEMMRASIEMAQVFSAERMLREYYNLLYHRLPGRIKAQIEQ